MLVLRGFFNPQLIDKPIIILSNNDTSIVARSDEAKLLGIRMGVPVFKIKDIIKRNNVVMLSSNYTTVYGGNEWAAFILS
ncbi:hypothetical protein L2Z40_18740 (plasmid) [Acinetobacter baumannii]|nr:hypothetical protein [Acinetobacter baumannii]UVU36986.1 hypothetical protein L2Z40_18740 [Acinetobacter baumannii]